MDWKVAQHSEYEELGGKGVWSNGILNIDLLSWDDFHGVTAKLLDLGDFVWRGQTRDWLLMSRFDREVKSGREAQPGQESILERHGRAFVRAIRGRRGKNPPELKDPNEIMALGQHYGLITPLLDWTESPFVAAYFAFLRQSCHPLMNPVVAEMARRCKTSNERKDVLKKAPLRFVYGLSKDIIRWGPAKSDGSEPSGHFFRWIDSPSDENPRLLSQRGLFIAAMSPEIDVEKTVEECYRADKEKGRSRIIFVKIQIPEIERQTCLRNLNRMNINHATLFPDLIGAAEYCNVKLEIEGYS